MALKRISDFPAAGTLTGTELVPVVQGGANKTATVTEILGAASGAVTSVFGRSGAVMASSGDYNSDEVTEGSANLYFTGDRVAGALQAGANVTLTTTGGVTKIDAAGGGGGGSAAWGGITGTLSDQTDLKTALDAKLGDAPSDGTVYGRKNGAWAVAPGGGTDRNVVTALVISGGNVAVDASLGDYFTLALTANATISAPTNVPPACSLMIEITQGATARTVAWPASFKWAGGAAGAVSTAAGAKDVLAITTFDGGSTWCATLAKAFA